MAIVQPTDAHHAFRDDLIDLLRKHAGELPAVQMLALAAHMVGQIIAMQDVTEVDGPKAMNIVMRNIEQGNAEAMDGVMGQPQGRA